MKFSRRGWLFAVVVGTLAAILVAWAAGYANDIYYMGHPFRGDTFSYFMKQMQLYLAVQENGAVNTVWRDFLTNARDPLRSVPYLLVSARELTSLNGHLYFNAFTYAAFAVTGIFCLHRRTGSWTYGVVIAALPVLAEGFLAPIHGFPSKLPDFPAALLGGAALFSLVASDRGRSLGWLSVFAAFTALSSLSRLIAAAYILVICGPVLVLYLLERWRQDGRRPGPVLLRLFVIGGVISLLAGHFLWVKLLPNLSFYGTEGYALFHTPLKAFHSTFMRFVYSHLGGIGIMAALILGIFYTGSFWAYRHSIRSLFDAVWPVIGFIILIVFVLRVEDDFTQMFYVIPGFALLAAAPFALLPKGQEMLKKSYTWTAALPSAMVFLAAAQVAYVTESQPLRAPYAAEWLQLNFQRALSGAMYNTILKTDYDKRPPTIEIAFAAYGRYIVGDLMIRRRLFIKWREVFELRRPVWESHFRGPPEQKIATVHDRILCGIDVLAMFEHPKKEETLIALKDTYSQDMAERLLRIVRDRPFLWQLETQVESPWGNVLVYLNLTRRKHAEVQKDMIHTVASSVASMAGRADAAGPIGIATFFGDGGREIAEYAATHLKQPAAAPGLLQEGLAAWRASSNAPVADTIATLHRELTQKVGILVLPMETLCPQRIPGGLDDRQTEALWALERRISQDSAHWRAGPTLATPYGPARVWENLARR